ncbi:MAG: metallophosphoesterase, partial [Propionibacteriales bacterium]|nr:metallophosphoesterase [Propionibacteriales bacterium]
NQGVGGCTATSPQTTWLKSDLASVDSVAQPCIAAFWHQPLWTGGKGSAMVYQAWWNALYNAQADVVLNGHVHNYQRFDALSPTGTPDPVNGITEYIVGTGGEALRSVNSTSSPHPVQFAKTFGYLRMTLEATGWTADFINASGTVLDQSTGICHI